MTANNSLGASMDAYSMAASAGLPVPWRQQDVGGGRIPDSILFDGQQFRLEDASSRFDSTHDQLQFAYLLLWGDGVLMAHFVQQASSQ